MLAEFDQKHEVRFSSSCETAHFTEWYFSFTHSSVPPVRVLELHLSSLDRLYNSSSYFFAYEKQNYARLVSFFFSAQGLKCGASGGPLGDSTWLQDQCCQMGRDGGRETNTAAKRGELTSRAGRHSTLSHRDEQPTSDYRSRHTKGS